MIEALPKRNLFIRWLSWHYGESAKDLLRIFVRFLVFNFEYFSIKPLIKTFFSHWRKYRESYGRGFDFKRYFYAFSSNMVSRVIGAIIRLITIIIGLAAEAILFIFLLVLYLGWIFMPAIIVILFYWGVYFAFLI